MTTPEVNPETLDNLDWLKPLVVDYLRDQKKRRFWLITRRSLIFLVLVGFAYWLFFGLDEESVSRSKPHVGYIKINGVIESAQSASAEHLESALKDAYQNSMLKALVLEINSPGGSPVEADDMYQLIRLNRSLHPDIKIYAVCKEVCASAAYYIAAAADEIYANQASIVGSIGVIYNGFGFVDSLEKLGVTRRLITAGDNKGFLDQFSPLNPKQEELMKNMLALIHQRFIDQVKAGRGERLHIDDETFSGLFWTGIQALGLGLIDGFKNVGQLAKETLHVNNLVDYTDKDNIIDQVSKNFGASILNEVPKLMGFERGIKARI